MEEVSIYYFLDVYFIRLHFSSMKLYCILKKRNNKYFKVVLVIPGVQLLPSALALILEYWIRVPFWAPCMEPVSPSACVPDSLCVCLS